MEARRAVSKVGNALSSLVKAPLTSASNSGFKRRKSSPDSVPESSIILFGLDCERCAVALIHSPFVWVRSAPSTEGKISVLAERESINEIYQRNVYEVKKNDHRTLN